MALIVYAWLFRFDFLPVRSVEPVEGHSIDVGKINEAANMEGPSVRVIVDKLSGFRELAEGRKVLAVFSRGKDLWRYYSADKIENAKRAHYP